MDKLEAKRQFAERSPAVRQRLRGPHPERPAVTVGDDGRWELRDQGVRVFRRENSPWVEIEVEEGALAIWARTGAVHPVTESGAVTDEPLDLPFPNEQPELGPPGHRSSHYDVDSIQRGRP